MEDKKQIKISLKMLIILIIILILTVGVLIYFLNKYIRKTNLSSKTNENIITIYSDLEDGTKDKEIEYTTKIGYYYGTANFIENIFVTSYEGLESYINQFGEVIIDGQNVLEFFDTEFFNNNTLAIETHDVSSSHKVYEIESVKEDGEKVNIDINVTHYSHGGDFAPGIKFTFIILDKNVKNANFSINYKRDYTRSEDSIM